MTTIELEDDRAREIGSRFVRWIAVDKKRRRMNLQKRKVIRDLYYGHNNRVPEYPGQSNMHFHVVTEKIEGITPKIVNSFWNADPIVHVQRIAEEFNQAETNNNETFINWAVDNDIPEAYATTEMWFRNTFIDGVSILKPRWERKVRNTVIVESIKTFWRAGEPDLMGTLIDSPRAKEPLEILTEVFGLPLEDPTQPHNALLSVDEIGENTFVVSFLEDRVEYVDITVEFHTSKFYDEVDVYIYRPVIVRDSVVWELLEYEDVIMPYRTSCLQTADYVAHQYWLSIEDIERRIEEEDWEIEEEELERLRAHAKGETFEDDKEDGDAQIKRQKDRHTGEDDLEGPLVDRSGKLLFYEVYTSEDINGDGVLEEVIFQVSYYLEKVAKTHFLEEPCPHGRRPFVDLHNIRISDRFWSMSYGELLAPINIEVNAVLNMVNEAQELINNPFFFYVPAAATVDPQVLSRIMPGQGVPVADVNSVMFPKFSQEPLANLAIIDFLLLFADRLTIVPQSVGSSQVRNAPRTARGTLALLSEAGVKTDIFIIAAQRGAWRELIHQTHALYAHFGPSEKYYYVTGSNRPKRITNKELRGRFEYSFSGNSINTNREVMRSIAQVRYNTMAGEPLFSMDLQARLALVEDFLRHFSEGTDVQKLLPKLPGQGGTHAPMTQETEVQVMKSGVYVEPLPTDDHANHLAALARVRTSSEFASFDPVTVSLLAIHERLHLQLLQAQMQQGMVPQGGNEGNNVPSGVGTSKDMNALEGGVQ